MGRRVARFLDGVLDRFTGLSGDFLNPAQELFLLSLGILEIIVRELGPLLFQLALGDVPVAFDLECCYSVLFFVCESPSGYTNRWIK